MLLHRDKNQSLSFMTHIYGTTNNYAFSTFNFIELILDGIDNNGYLTLKFLVRSIIYWRGIQIDIIGAQLQLYSWVPGNKTWLIKVCHTVSINFNNTNSLGLVYEKHWNNIETQFIIKIVLFTNIRSTFSSYICLLLLKSE